MSAVVQCKIDTRNEYLLMVGTSLHYDKASNNEARIRCAHMPLARVIALQQPSKDPDRCMLTMPIAGVDNGTYDHCETAAFVYNVITRLKYGDQLDKMPQLLDLVGPDSRVTRSRRKPTASRHIAGNSIRETRTQQRAAQRSCAA